MHWYMLYLTLFVQVLFFNLHECSLYEFVTPNLASNKTAVTSALMIVNCILFIAKKLFKKKRNILNRVKFLSHPLVGYYVIMIVFDDLRGCSFASLPPQVPLPPSDVSWLYEWMPARGIFQRSRGWTSNTTHKTITRT